MSPVLPTCSCHGRPWGPEAKDDRGDIGNRQLELNPDHDVSGLRGCLAWIRPPGLGSLVRRTVHRLDADRQVNLSGFCSSVQEETWKNEERGGTRMTIRTGYDVGEFDFDVIVPATQASYWGNGRERNDIIKSFRNSFPVGLFHWQDGQIGWARATSDTVYHAYIYDLQVVPDHRGKGLGKHLVTELMRHPELKDVSGWMLSTRHHHGFYRPLGFEDAEHGRYMVLTKDWAEPGSRQINPRPSGFPGQPIART